MGILVEGAILHVGMLEGSVTVDAIEVAELAEVENEVVETLEELESILKISLEMRHRKDS